MARNEEKRQAMLNRWWEMKKDIGKKVESRPKGHNKIHTVQTINECEKWR